MTTLRASTRNIAMIEYTPFIVKKKVVVVYIPPAITNYILKVDGSYLLLQNGSKILKAA